MKRFAFVLFILTHQLHGHPTPPPAVFYPIEPSNFAPFLPKVNIVTGEYCEDECDLYVAGIQPLSYRRFYGHMQYRDMTYGHWRINPEAQMLFHFSPADRQPGESFFASIGDRNGASTLCTKRKGDQLYVDTKINRSFAGHGTGRGHPLNTIFTFKKHKPGKQESYWHGSIFDGTGSEREYCSEIGTWGISELSSQFQARVLKEKLPNGNFIVYSYQHYDQSQDRKDKPLDTYYILNGITAYNSKGLEINSISISYDRYGPKNKIGVKGIHVKGSDNRACFLKHENRCVQKMRRRRMSFTEHEYQFDIVLKSVRAIGKPEQTYEYIHDHASSYFDHPFLENTNSYGIALKTQYHHETKKVVSQSAPLGPNSESVPIAKYSYQANSTTVLDAMGQKTVYHFDKDKRVTMIERYEGSELLSVEQKTWDKTTGNLLQHTIADGNQKVLKKSTFRYDTNHNAIQETSGDYTVYRTFDPHFNVVTKEWDDHGKRMHFEYKPGTNLLQTVLVYDGDKICKRAFNAYDESAVCIESIVDDGHTRNKSDLADVTYRRITRVQPKRNKPCFGLPETVCEYTVDFNGAEVLLHKTKYSYHPSGKVEREDHYDADDQYSYSIVNEYDRCERLVRSIDPLGYERSYVYDDRFNLRQILGPKKGASRSREYDAGNRVRSETIGELTTHFAYDRMNRLISKVEPTGHETSYNYDALGNLKAIVYADAGKEIREYDPLGNLTRMTDPNGYTTMMTYNDRGQPLTIDYPDKTSESFTYNPNGTLATHTTVNGTKKFSYDILGNVIRTEDGDRFTSATYSAFCLLSKTDAEGVTTFYEYDFAGRKIAERCEKRLTTYEYDALGRQSAIHEGDITTYFIYNVVGQLIEKRINDCFCEQYSYDEDGNQTETRTCQGTTTTKYNDLGLPILKVDACGNQTTINHYFDKNHREEITDPNGVTTTVIYDPKGKPLYWQKGDLVRKKRYDQNGNLVEANENGVVHRWSYGPRNRLEKFCFAEARTTGYVYDESGRLAITIKPDSIKHYRKYDAHGRLTQHFGPDFDYQYRYDRNDRLLQAGATKRTYDIHGNMVMEELENGYRLTSTYSPYGKRLELQLPDKSEIHYSYEGPYLKSVEYMGYEHCYEKRNLSGNPIQFNNTRIEYDACHRWKRVASPHFSREYKYDCCGNLVSDSSHEYTYDEHNQLVEEDSAKYEYDIQQNRIYNDGEDCAFNNLSQNIRYKYDANGNLLCDEEHEYAYDSLDRLISCDGVSITYDAFNRRMKRGGISFIWDDKREIGAPSELRILGEGFGAEIGAAILLKLGNKFYIPTHDHRGSIVALSTLDGELVERYDYNGFGEEMVGSGISPWRFASKRHDDSGLIYFGIRYYIPSQGRWLTPDPLGLADGSNLYAFVHNNPHHLDLFGLFDESKELSGYALDIAEYFSTNRTLKGSSHTSSLKEKGYSVVEMPYGGIGIFINGINGDEDTITHMAKYLSEQGGGVNIHMACFVSQGILHDITEVAKAKFEKGLIDEINNLRAQMQRLIKESSDGSPILAIAYSGGSQVLAGTLHQLSDSQRQRFIVKCFAPSVFIDPEMCKSIRNYVAEGTRDLVPQLDLIGWLKYRDTIEVVKSNPSASRFDHSLLSPTYTPYIKDAFDSYYDDIRKLQ